MPDAYNVIINRRACRAFKPDQVPQDLVNKIVNAGLYAPSGKGAQAPIVVVIRNPEVIKKLSRINAEIGWGEKAGLTIDPFYGAPTVICVLAKKEVGTYVYDGSLCMGNMMLEAEELGIASIWIHRCKETFATPEGKKILRGLGLDPEAYEGIGNCCLGYAATPKNGPKPRNPGRVYQID